jgi:hypothetical protein
VLSHTPENVYKELNDAIVFNMSMEAVSKYSLCRIADRSQHDTLFNRLLHSVLYLETDTERFELTRHGETIRIARVLCPRLKTERWMATQTVPLNNTHVEIKSQAPWNDHLWSETHLEVANGSRIGPICNYVFRTMPEE